MNSPLVHIGGVFRVLQCIADARPFVLVERFELNAWAAAVRRHRPRAAGTSDTARGRCLRTAAAQAFGSKRSSNTNGLASPS
ncbi:hypothetical protein MAHJHV28_47160 [Mycobacterium avium subsp. hominissuis]